MRKKIKKIIALSIIGAILGLAGTLFAVSLVQPPQKTLPISMLQPRHLASVPNIALVLGSGGARGYAHLGVIAALKQNHIPINLITCSSAGCIMGAMYADNNNIKAATHNFLDAHYSSFIDLYNLGHSQGPISGASFIHFYQNKLIHKNIQNFKTPMIMATTDLKTGKTISISQGSATYAALASGAIPGLVRPVHIGSHYLVDGGVNDQVPVDLAQQAKAKIIIAVNIAKQLPNKLPQSSSGTYMRATNLMWKKLIAQSLQGANIIIRPPVGNDGMFDLGNKQQLYQAGYQAALQQIPAIKKIMEEKGISLTQ